MVHREPPFGLTPASGGLLDRRERKTAGEEPSASKKRSLQLRSSIARHDAGALLTNSQPSRPSPVLHRGSEASSQIMRTLLCLIGTPPRVPGADAALRAFGIGHRPTADLISFGDRCIDTSAGLFPESITLEKKLVAASARQVDPGPRADRSTGAERARRHAERRPPL